MTAYSFPDHDATAVVGRRIGAWFIDLLIYLILAWVLSLAISNNGSQQRDLTGAAATGSQFCDQWNRTHDGFCFKFSSGGKTTALTYESSAYPFIVVFGHMALYALFQGLLGGSLGKLAVGLRVVDSNGELCGIGRSFIRTFMWVVDAITFMLPIVGGVLLLSTKGHRRVGDMAASTYVVDKSDVGHTVQIPGVAVPAGVYGSAPGGAPLPWSQPPVAPDGPRWDAERDTYIQWDQASSAWLEWDEQTKQWKAIST